MIKHMRITLLLSVFLVVVSCANDTKSKKKCDLESISTLFTVPTGRGDYAHYILVKDMSRVCMDSVTLVEAAIHYIDTVKFDRPVFIVKFYTSDRYLIKREISQPIKFENDCIVGIGMDTLNSNKPVNFYFRSEKGELLYWGPLWKPHG